jgi:putative FmdB family regulatory protein
MPIYAYRCEACGHAKDVLQKFSDPQLETCPACGAGAFRKQITAAGFQLKGSGWYVTDFRNGASAGAKSSSASSPDSASPSTESAAAPASSSSSSSETASTASGGCGASCACH